MNYRSHNEAQVTAALLHGKEVWALDTANEGDDDQLIGTYTQVLSDVLHHHELDALPAEWSLDRVPAPDYVEVLVATVYGRSVGETGLHQRHAAYLRDDMDACIPCVRVLPKIGELRFVEMLLQQASQDEGGPLDLVLAQFWTREAFIADQCEKMNGHSGAVYAAFGRG